MTALAISHTPWVPARVESLGRLVEQLGPLGRTDLPGTEVRVFSDRAPNWAWSEEMWRWGAETQAQHVVFLQDDVIVAPNFFPALHAMLEAVPDQVIGLEAAHPYGKRLALEGHRWYTTGDFLVGPGYVLPRALLGEFLKWRRDALRPHAVEYITEDTMIGLWCWCTRRRIWHPIPTIIDHDLTIESTYGNGAHKHRRPSVTWKDTDVVGFELGALENAEWWERGYGDFGDSGPEEPHQGPPHLGRVYNATPWTARMWLRDPASMPDYAAEDAETARYRIWL